LGALASGHIAGNSTAGARALGLAIAPARFTARTTSPANEKEFGDSAPTARPQKTGAQKGSRLRLEWIAGG